MLSGLLPQLTEETELLVRDDSMNTESKEVFDRLFAGKEIRHQYFSGDKIGLDLANLFLLEKAEGRFVWSFSDDDEMRAGAIQKVLDLIKRNNDIRFIWVNYDYREEGRLAYDRQDGFFDSGDDALRTLGINLGFLSSLIFKRKSALPSFELAKKHAIGFSFALMVPVLYILSKPGKFYFIRGPYIFCHPSTQEDFIEMCNRDGVIINDITFNSYGVNFHSVLMEFKGKFDRRILGRILSDNFASLWRGMLVGWIGGWDTPSGKIFKLLKHFWMFPQCWIALLFFLMPLWLNRRLYKLYKVFFSHRKFVFFKMSDS